MEWYEQINAEVPLTQGDIIFDCPLIGWQAEIDFKEEEYKKLLRASTQAISADVVVLSQSCDLEHNKIANVILCSHNSMTEYRSAWDSAMKNKGQTITPKAWKSHCDDICDGFIWNLTMLNSFEFEAQRIDVRIVDFHEIFTVPRLFLESLLKQRKKPRIRLLPPYREHLSQAFARFFMRVGLPIPINPVW